MPDIHVELRPAWRNYWPGFLLAGFLLMASIGEPASEAEGAEALGGLYFLVALIIIGYIVLKRYSWKFTINADRVTKHYGIISRNQQSVRIRDIRSVELAQGLVQRLLGIGNVLFYSAGTGSAEVKFNGIKKPAEWRDHIDRAIDQLGDKKE